MGSLRGFAIRSGPALTILTGYACSKVRMTIARAQMTSTRAPYGTHRGHVRVIEIRGLHAENP